MFEVFNFIVNNLLKIFNIINHQLKQPKNQQKKLEIRVYRKEKDTDFNLQVVDWNASCQKFCS